MIAYVDSSVLLRIVLGERDRLQEWESFESGVSSALTEVECLRTLDRQRLRDVLPAQDLALRRAAVFRILERLAVVELTRPVLARASQPFPSPLGTLDSLHLASALLWQESTQVRLLMATHDAALALAARASGLEVVGV